MADTVKLPGLGPVKKQTAYILGGVAVLVVGVAWYRSRAVGGAAAAESGAAAVAGDSSINPATGYLYGSEADLAALGQQAAIGGGGAVGYTGYGGNGANYDTGVPSTGGGFTTNAQWSQAAEDYLVNTVGADANTVGNALGKYITGQPLSPDQVNIVQQAIAFTNYPPLNGPTGYPPSYRTSTEPPPTTPPASTGGAAPGAVTGIHVVRSTGGYIVVDWTQPPGELKGFTLYQDGKVRYHHPNYSLASWSGLKRNTSYRLGIAAVGANGKEGPVATITAKTTR